MIFSWVPPVVTVRTPGRIVATTGACPASTPKSPSCRERRPDRRRRRRRAFPARRDRSGRWPWVRLSVRSVSRGYNAIAVDRARLPAQSLLAYCYRPAIRRLGRLGRELLALLDRLFDGADHVEGRLRQIVVLAFADALKPWMVSARSTNLPGEPVKTSATWNGCDRKRSILRARATAILSSSDSSSMPRMAMMSCSDL